MGTIHVLSMNYGIISCFVVVVVVVVVVFEVN